MERPGQPKLFRSAPVELFPEEVSTMLRAQGFFDCHMNNLGKGIIHQYERQGDVVIDKSTNLMWQLAASANRLDYVDGKNYIRRLNSEKFAGYNTWRLPTLEEAMSLMEPDKAGGAHLNDMFAAPDAWICTADKEKNDFVTAPWVVYFPDGYCYISNLYRHHYIRAVR